MNDDVSDRSPWSVRFEEVPIWAVVQAILIVGCAFLPVPEIDDINSVVVFGLTISQCVLAGVWLVLGPGHILWRLPVAPLWVLIATALAGLEHRPYRAFDVYFSAGVCAAGIVVASMIALRLVFRLKVARQDQTSSPQPLQYRLQHLLGLILVTSLLLGVGRLVSAPIFAFFRSNWWYDPFMMFGVPWGVALLPMTFVALGTRGAYLRIGLAAATGWFVAVELVGLWYQYEDFFDVAETMAIVGVVAYLATLGGLMLQRAEGYRLTR
jgi:hypothetical protein